MAHYMVDSEPTTGRKRRGYHHGDLRHDLLRVARDEIARHGADSVSLASLARLAGVSQPAPYRHFADRNALLEAVAAQGFREFAATLIQAIEHREAGDAVDAVSLAYVTFGEDNTELYSLMFASRLTPQAKQGSELDEAAGRAFGLLRAAMFAASSQPVEEKDIYRVWAQLHGLVMLKADGFVARGLENYLTKYLQPNGSQK